MSFGKNDEPAVIAVRADELFQHRQKKGGCTGRASRGVGRGGRGGYDALRVCPSARWQPDCM